MPLRFSFEKTWDKKIKPTNLNLVNLFDRLKHGENYHIMHADKERGVQIELDHMIFDMFPYTLPHRLPRVIEKLRGRTNEATSVRFEPVTPCNLRNLFRFFCIKVSGIPSGNKLIKTIGYPHI